jgi:hypothetical protein
VLLAVDDPASAAGWGAIVPGQSTVAAVRAHYGEPSRAEAVKIEGYDASQWTYDGERAPQGIRRLTIEFGLLTPTGYRPDLARLIRLEPNPGIFTRMTVLNGWGWPTKSGKDGEVPVFFYQEGLVVEFDREGWLAVRMTFTPPQPAP